MINSEFKKYRNLEVIQANSAGELKTLLARINIPFDIIWVYYADKKHIAFINPIRPLRRIVTKKSPRNTDQKYKE